MLLTFLDFTFLNSLLCYIPHKALSTIYVNFAVWLSAAGWSILQVEQTRTKVQGLQKKLNPSSQYSYLVSIKINSISSYYLSIPLWGGQLLPDCWLLYANVSVGETIITFSINLCPAESLWSSTSLWKTNFILHSWQIQIAFRSSGCM